MTRLATLLIAVVGAALAAAEPAVTGPMLGTVDERTAQVWLRPPGAATVTLIVRDPAGKTVFEEPRTAAAEHDFCLTWAVTGLGSAG